MNMKKTIAAVAAGAVAVSAMATTVSALEAKTLTYNLVKTTKNQDAKGTVTATFTNVPLEAGGKLVVEPVSEYGAHSWDTVVTISGSFWDDAAGTNKSFVPVVATGMDWETGYSVEGSRLWNDTKVEVPVVANLAAGTNVALKATSSAVITVTVKFGNLPDSVNYVGAVNGLIKDEKLGIKIHSFAAGQQAGANSVATFTSGTTGGSQVLFVTPEVQTALNEAAGKDGFNAEYDGAKWVQAGVAPTFTVNSLTEAAGSVNGLTVADVKLTNPAATVGAGTYTNEQYNNAFTLTSDGTDWTDQYGNVWTGITLDAKITGAVAENGDTITLTGAGGVNKGTTAITGAASAATALKIAATTGDKLNVTGYTGGAAGTSIYDSPLSGAATEQSGNSEKKVPYHSALKNNTITNFNQGWYDGNNVIIGDNGSGNVLTWIGYASDDNKTWATSDHQAVSNAVMAVINDAVQNYDDVVFTFNTATSNVKIIRDQQGKITDYEYTGDAVKARENKDKGSEEIVNYTAFGRHYWDRDTGYDANTIYINNDWLGNNLFEGALVINNNLTLSLGATDKFDWTATSLSFSWDAIQDAALTQNQYANYIQTMILRTSTDWFWDNMTVTLGETETEEVDSGAPVEADDTDLPEDEVEEDLGDIEEEEEEEEPVEDVEPEPEPEPAPVEEATNPGTGNASVALAVIPVALAAAAIVAKKRG